MQTGPSKPRSTILSDDEEAAIMAFRRHTLLPLDDRLHALQPSIPHLTRSALHHCLRRYGISRSLLLRWRRSFRPEPNDAAVQPTGFVPARMVPASVATPGSVGPAGAIEIEFAAGVRMRITGAVDAATLKAAVAALADGRPR